MCLNRYNPFTRGFLLGVSLLSLACLIYLGKFLAHQDLADLMRKSAYSISRHLGEDFMKQQTKRLQSELIQAFPVAKSSTFKRIVLGLKPLI